MFNLHTPVVHSKWLHFFFKHDTLWRSVSRLSVLMFQTSAGEAPEQSLLASFLAVIASEMLSVLVMALQRCFSGKLYVPLKSYLIFSTLLSNLQPICATHIT